jgi:putative ABC transport system substrate-binding protein
VRRREFIAGFAGAAAWPLAAWAQQPAIPVIGFLRSESLAASPRQVAAFRLGLKELGFVEGQNVAIEYHSAEGQVDRLPALVAELIRRPVAVMGGNAIAMLVAKAATTAVPIIFASGGDPVQDGLLELVSNLKTAKSLGLEVRNTSRPRR